MHDIYEMTAKGNGVVAVVSSSKELARGGISRDNALVVLRTIEVFVESESVKGKEEDASSSESSSWVP